MRCMILNRDITDIMLFRFFQNKLNDTLEICSTTDSVFKI